MNLKEEIEQIWNEDTEGMESVISRAITLIKEAIKDKSELPLETVIDILITANTTVGFGGKYEEAELLLVIYTITLQNDNPGSIPKIQHFACLIYGVILSLLTVDESTSDRKVPGIMKVMNVKTNASRTELIRTLLHHSYPLLKDVKPSYWVMELISFILTGICLIQDFDKLTDNDLIVEEFLKKIHQESKNDLVLEKWRSRWLEASDYHRFTTSLIFGEHAKEEEAWLNRARRLFP
ncbi:MAG: hypothetical protein GPJ54_13765 [Candidatus Heimdallarchaeota archaeon]|nr:hypothetical protein [Candidatus Heimdallarchaeota archaeon]